MPGEEKLPGKAGHNFHSIGAADADGDPRGAGTQRQAEQASPAQPGHRAFLRCRIGHTHSRTVTVSCDSGSARVLIWSDSVRLSASVSVPYETNPSLSEPNSASSASS